MSAFYNLSQALNKRLSLVPNLPPVAWPNVEYESVENTAFVRPTLLPSASTLYTLNAEHRNPGIYQIDVFVPLEKGSARAYRIVDSIKDHFELQRTLPLDQGNVFIEAISLGRLERQDSWLRIYLEVNYNCLV